MSKLADVRQQRGYDDRALRRFVDELVHVLRKPLPPCPHCGRRPTRESIR